MEVICSPSLNSLTFKGLRPLRRIFENFSGEIFPYVVWKKKLTRILMLVTI